MYEGTWLIAEMSSINPLMCILILFHLLPMIWSMDEGCRLDAEELEGISQPGDVMIGTVLPIHLDKVYQHVSFTERPPRTTCVILKKKRTMLTWLPGLEFHTEKRRPYLRNGTEEKHRRIKGNSGIYTTFDSCTMLQQDLEGTLKVLSGFGVVIPNYRCLNNVPLSSVIGHSISTHSMAVAHILGLYRYVQISHFSTSSLLSDRSKFPSFFRTIPSDTFQSQGLAQLVHHFNWTWVGLLAVDNDYGQHGIQLVKKEIAKTGACVAFTETIKRSQPDRNAPYIVKTMKMSTANVVVVFSNDIDFVPILDEMLRQNITKKTLIASEAWSTSTVTTMGKFIDLLPGTIGFALYSGIILGFQAFLNKVDPSTSLGKNWVKLLWEQTFNCKFFNDSNISKDVKTQNKKCTGEESLERVLNSYNDVSSLRVTYNVYNAVHMVAKVLEDLSNCNKITNPFSNSNCAKLWNFEPWQLLKYMKRVRLTLTSGRELFFDENGDPPAVYDIVNWMQGPDEAIKKVKAPSSICSPRCPFGYRKTSIEKEPVCCFHCIPCPQGEISNQTDVANCHQCPWNEWPNAEKSRCLHKAIEFLSYNDVLGSTLASISLASSLVPIAILKLFIRHKSTPIVKANNFSLSWLLLICLSFCFISALFFIGYPNSEKCLLRQITFGIVFSLCIACILAKTLMVVFAFLAIQPCSRLQRFSKISFSYILIFICVFLQCILCITWLVLAPPFPQYNVHDLPSLIIVECNEGSALAFWCMLGYLGLLAFISFFVAFVARRLPDTFNEATYITFSMLAFVSVWMSYVPASLSSRGKYTVAMEVFAILSSSWSLVICMFLPKCFILLLRPNLNTTTHVNIRM
ncbi:extracellular calcium-sensing receptor-like [Phyllobates terribilis]|uniref:extracellular calcium-sensing receptor-like n=1 Tax=Phyllobates terribilis TaxID=111132 RepID=UPI003CCAEFD7